MVTFIGLEIWVTADNPLREIRRLADEALAGLPPG
jgi:hypothetical protein